MWRIWTPKPSLRQRDLQSSQETCRQGSSQQVFAVAKAKADLERGIAKDCEVLFPINRQSPDITDCVDVNKGDLDAGVDDQSIMFGYVNNETEDAIPFTCLMVTRLEKKLSDVRKNGDLRYILTLRHR